MDNDCKGNGKTFCMLEVFHYYYFLFSPKDMLINLILEREEGKDRERIETSM